MFTLVMQKIDSLEIVNGFTQNNDTIRMAYRNIMRIGPLFRVG